MVSNAERRALVNVEALAGSRISDVYAALPGITGKLELEYEGEMRGADTWGPAESILTVSRWRKIYDRYFSETNTRLSNGSIWGHRQA